MTDKPKNAYRIAVFDSVAKAEHAIQGLIAQGFEESDISVVCSDETKRKQLDAVASESDPEPPPGDHKGPSVPTGAAIGGLLGGAVTLVATGGLGILAVGPILMGGAGGALAGSFAGFMAKRGVEDDVADYYDQAVAEGKILVGAHAEGDDARDKLTHAEAMFVEAGAIPKKTNG